jgi:trans-aconitate methyltransferase
MTTYHPPTYWVERGRTYEQEAHERGWWAVQNEPILALVDRLRFRSVLEVGCGFARVGAAILARHPGVAYTGLDISPDLIDGGRRLLPDQEFIVADLASWETDRRWDLVLSVSVLGHLLPADVRPTIAKLRRWARRDLVTVDWDEVGGETEYQFGHDYRAIYGADAVITPYGRQSIFWVARP